MTDPSVPDRRAPGRLEDEVIASLAAAAVPMTTADVLADLGDDLAYTTVLTTLARLHEKGLLARTREGRSYAYTLRPPEERVARSMSAALEQSPDRDLALARFVDELEDDDIPLLRRLLADEQRADPPTG